jgi:hypothetical protein
MFKRLVAVIGGGSTRELWYQSRLTGRISVKRVTVGRDGKVQ